MRVSFAAVSKRYPPTCLFYPVLDGKVEKVTVVEDARAP